jgi:AraC-like DNA-binding protein
MSSLVNLDLILRGAAVALAVTAASAIALHPRRNRAALWAAAVVGGVGAFLIASTPGVEAALGPVAYFFNAWCLATPAAVWMLSYALFREQLPKLTPGRIVAVSLWVTMTMVGDYGRFGIGPMAASPEIARAMLILGRMVGVALLFAACALAAAHWRVDLVEHRRRARAAFVALSGAMFVVLASSDFVFGKHGAAIELLVAGHAIVLLLGLALVLYLVLTGPGELLSEPAPRLATPVLALVRGDAAEAALAAQVTEAMTSRKLWKREGLSIAGLAGELHTQEYRLRRAINRHLGYRNFNEFLHDYRLREVAARLADPAERHLPVLTIALDAGYGSIGPFNVAFKARFGVTPTQFRNQQAIVQESASQAGVR